MKSFDKTILHYLRRFAEVAVVSVCLMLFASTWVQAQVKSRMGEEGLRFGRSLFDSMQLTHGNAAGPLSRHELTINGARVRVESRTLHGDADTLIEAAMQTLRAECETPREALPLPPLSEAEEQALKKLHFDSNTQLFGNVVIQATDRKEQALYCFKPAHPLSLRGIAVMARTFKDSRDLNDLGTWKGVYAKAGDNSVSFLTLEAQGSFRPELMFPKTGDVPGEEFKELPRPPGRRTLSIAHNENTALNTYLSPLSLVDSLSDYETQLKNSGLRSERPAQTGTPGNVLFLRSHSVSYVVSGTSQKSGSTLLIAALPD